MGVSLNLARSLSLSRTSNKLVVCFVPDSVLVLNLLCLCAMKRMFVSPQVHYAETLMSWRLGLWELRSSGA